MDILTVRTRVTRVIFRENTAFINKIDTVTHLGCTAEALQAAGRRQQSRESNYSAEGILEIWDPGNCGWVKIRILEKNLRRPNYMVGNW